MARTDVKGTRKQPKADAAQIIEQMASEGYSRRNIAKALSVSYELFVAWLDKYPELSYDQVKKIVLFPWFFLKSNMESGKFENVRLKYSGSDFKFTS